MNTFLYAAAPLPPYGWLDPQEALKERLKRDAIEEQDRQSTKVSQKSPVEPLVRFIPRAGNGYDTAELNDIVNDAKKVVSK